MQNFPWMDTVPSHERRKNVVSFEKLLSATVRMNLGKGRLARIKAVEQYVYQQQKSAPIRVFTTHG